MAHGSPQGRFSGHWPASSAARLIRVVQPKVQAIGGYRLYQQTPISSSRLTDHQRGSTTSPSPPAPERDDSLSSVLDIRRPSTSHRPSNTGSREDSFPPLRRFTGDAEGPASDFSLATSDLVTPISPESGENEIVGVRFSLSCRQGVI